ncbi:unnamed protein product, partial [Onchocerca ochengi]|uniref:Uncharacterized protein n=1 Tax=Onchocerca ochengi TaxID=42157 RepID=A0A182EXP8_ONCOC
MEKRKERVASSETLQLPQLEEPPKPLKTLLIGYTAEPKRFLS